MIEKNPSTVGGYRLAIDKIGNKIKKSLPYAGVLLVVILFNCSDKKEAEVDTAEKVVVPATLPKKIIDLTALSAFKSPGDNWKVVGGVSADLNSKHEFNSKEGVGVLLNQPSESANANLFTNFEHGDIELELEFMMPKESNSGIYLQGRYEVQLFDSWQVDPASYADCGGIYQRWDESRGEGKEGYEGVPPIVNASKAPGLWQRLAIDFQAPRYDDSGNKVANAIFKSVKLNGYMIHRDVEVTGPTRAAAFADEKATGPLMIQGDHGPVAFRNLKYKSYTQDLVTLENISYEVFEGNWNTLPDFSTLEPVSSGTDSVIRVSEASGKRDHFAMIYNGNITIPVSGEYIFTSVIDDGGEFFIDNQSVCKREKGPGGGTSRGLITLEKGTYPFMLTYFQDVWGASIRLYYEGPGIAKKPVGGLPVKNDYKPHEPIKISTSDSPAIQRSFINHRNSVKTHVISVGTPQNIHYTYDLKQGALVKFWKGEFADTYGMWHSRGGTQKLQPGNFAIDAMDGQPIARLLASNAPWPQDESVDYTFKKYLINKEKYPVFTFEYRNAVVEDLIIPSADHQGLSRTINIKMSGNADKLWYRLATSSYIELLSNGYYSVGGEYFLKLDNLNADQVTIRENKELLFQITENQTTLQYSILW